MKIVINKCYGGFGLSVEGVQLYAKLSGFKLYPFVEKRDTAGRLDFSKPQKFEPYKGQRTLCVHYSKKPLNKDGTYDKDFYWLDRGLERNDPKLIEVVEKLREKANGRCASLEIVEIPDDVEWEIDDYDGVETIHEKHRSWG